MGAGLGCDVMGVTPAYAWGEACGLELGYIRREGSGFPIQFVLVMLGLV